MSMYIPDAWVVFKIKSDDPHYRVLGSWAGGYLDGDSWRMNSGITSVKVKKDSYIFKGSSGSEYLCRKAGYGLRMNTSDIVRQYELKHPGLIEVMPEDTNWTKVDWIIK